MSAPSVITIGNFDGVHRGHRAILRRARAMADERRARVVALTFDPHPLTVLRPASAPPRLMSQADKTRALRAAGADHVVVLEPTPALLGRTAEQFVHQFVSDYQPVAVVEGPDFRFGKGRAGDSALLTAMGATLGFQAVVVERVEQALTDQLLVPVTSSVVRWLLCCGRVADAARCLGEAFALEAKVVEGEKRGRTLGVPTANLAPADLAGFVQPASGVYAGLVHIINHPSPMSDPYPAAISIGSKPTFGSGPPIVEVHLLDFTGDLYGRRLRVEFLRWLRDQQVFPDVEALRAQIGRDLERVRFLRGRELLACC